MNDLSPSVLDKTSSAHQNRPNLFHIVGVDFTIAAIKYQISTIIELPFDNSINPTRNETKLMKIKQNHCKHLLHTHTHYALNVYRYIISK